MPRDAWAGSTRRQRLPSDWPARVRATEARVGGQCEATTHAPGCDGAGAQCDHIVRGDDHELANLQWLSDSCHAAKTQLEAQAARGVGPTRQRPPRRHPGTPA
jgi:5-methylcytosine-specific restriction protein A